MIAPNDGERGEGADPLHDQFRFGAVADQVAQHQDAVGLNAARVVEDRVEGVDVRVNVAQ